MLALAWNSWGDVGQWVGAVATLAVGALAGAITWLQYRNSVFRPAVEAVAEAKSDAEGKQVVVLRVFNRGGAPGLIERVRLLDGQSKLTPVEWKAPWNQAPPVPFLLPGKASAILVLQQPNMLGADVRVEVIYGDRKERGYTIIDRVDFAIMEYTLLPPEALGIRTPPCEAKPVGAPD